jgi:hypothetical protein
VRARPQTFARRVRVAHPGIFVSDVCDLPPSKRHASSATISISIRKPSAAVARLTTSYLWEFGPAKVNVTSSQPRAIKERAGLSQRTPWRGAGEPNVLAVMRSSGVEARRIVRRASTKGSQFFVRLTVFTYTEGLVNRRRRS